MHLVCSNVQGPCDKVPLPKPLLLAVLVAVCIGNASLARGFLFQPSHRGSGRHALHVIMTCCRELKPHRLVEATAYKNRVFLLALTANGRQWRKSEEKLKTIQQSFDIMA